MLWVSWFAGRDPPSDQHVYLKVGGGMMVMHLFEMRDPIVGLLCVVLVEARRSGMRASFMQYPSMQSKRASNMTR